MFLSCVISLCYLGIKHNGVRNPVMVFWHCFFIDVIFPRVTISPMICIVDVALDRKKKTLNPIYLFIYTVKCNERNSTQHKSGQ